MACGDKEAVVFINERSLPTSYYRWMPCLIGAVLVTSLASTVVCIGMYMVTLKALNELKSISTQEQHFQPLGTAQELKPTQWLHPTNTVRFDAHSRSKRRVRGRRNRRGRRRRQSSQHHDPHTPRNHTYVHLVGTTSYNDDASFYYGNFVWSLFNSNEPPAPGLGIVNNTHPYLIRVDHAGIYEVYSQIGIEGRRTRSSRNSHIACGHKTVLSRNNVDTVLMESRVTQHNLGEEYRHGVIRGHAFDTIIHKGTFKLLRNDTLRVRMVDNCNHFKFKSNPTFAYFGVVQLHSFHSV